MLLATSLIFIAIQYGRNHHLSLLGIKNDYTVFKAFYVAFSHECNRGYFPLLNSYNRNIMGRI